MNDTPPEICTARLLNHNAEKGFLILTDGKERFFCGGRHFPSGLSPDQFVSFTVKLASEGKGRLREVLEVLFQRSEENI